MTRNLTEIELTAIRTSGSSITLQLDEQALAALGDMPPLIEVDLDGETHEATWSAAGVRLNPQKSGLAEDLELAEEITIRRRPEKPKPEPVDRRLCSDKPIASVDVAAGKVRGCCSGTERAARRAALVEAMLSVPTAHYLGRASDGEYYLAQLELPPPVLTLRWLGRGKREPAPNLLADDDSETTEESP